MDTENHTGPSAGTSIGPGTRLNDIFEIDEKIAVGGMGEVFRGHNVTTDEAVAIKIVLGEFARDEKYANLFFKEARVLSSLNHPSIVRYQIFTIDKAIGRPYLVMEYIHGMSLAERLGTGPLSVAEVRRLTAKLADGLETAHAAGVVHRDLSPDNILLSNNDVAHPKLIDFGIARTTQAGQKTFLAGEFAGRTNFASPEQFGLFGGNVEAASDVYSLGLVVINALQGVPLDMNGTQYEMIEKRKRIPELSNLDPDLRPIIEEMLVPDPANRHLTMADVANYFSGREPLANLKRSVEVPVDDPDDFWTKLPDTVPVTTAAERTPEDSGTTLVSGSSDEPATAPEPDRRQQVPAAATIIANAPMPPVASAPMPPLADIPPREETPPQFEPPMVEAKPIVWETQPVITTRGPAALPVRKRGRVWPYALTAAVLVLAAGGAGAFYSGALKNVVLPPELDALLGRKADDKVAQDDLPDLTAQPDRPTKKRDHVAADQPMRTKTRPAITEATQEVPVKEKTGKKNDTLTTEVASTTTTVAKSTVEAANPKVDNSATAVEVKPNVVETAKVEAKPKADDTAQIGATLAANETAKIDTKPKIADSQESDVTVQKTETSSDNHKAEATADSQTSDNASDTTTDNADNSGGMLPDNNQDKVAQNKLPTEDADKQSSDASTKSKTDSALPHDDKAAADVTKPLSSDTSKQDLDQTSGKVENPVVQTTAAAENDDKVAQEENPSTVGKSAEANNTKHVEPVDHVASDTTAGKPASTTSLKPVATVDNQNKNNETTETHVAATVTNPVKTEDTTNDTDTSEPNIGLPSDVLPSEGEVKTTPSNVTANNVGETTHDAVKPSDAVTENQVSPQDDHQADSTANKTIDTAETETKPADSAADDSQLPAANDNSATKTDNSVQQTEEATSKTDQATDTTTQSEQLPATNDNGKNAAKPDNDTQQTEQATDKTNQTTDTETKPSDNSADNNQQPATNDNSEKTADNAGQDNTDKTSQSADTETTPSDTTADSGLPDETKTHIDNNNSADNSANKPEDQSQSTDVAVGEPTTEIKHPEIAVDEGLAKRDSWVASFVGGDCFYARMTTNVASAAGIMAVAADSQPFYSLNDSFTSTFGLEPALRGLPIDTRQCAVTDLLKQVRQAPNEALDLQLTPSDQVVSGDPLSSQVNGVNKPFMTAYLFDNDGKVYDLSKDVRNKAGHDVELEYRGKEAKSKVKTFKIMLLIGSDKPLAVDFPKKPPLAKNIVPAIAKAINLQPGGVQYAYGFFKVVPKTN